jgi:uncharacterized protein (TIGR03086 family)
MLGVAISYACAYDMHMTTTPLDIRPLHRIAVLASVRPVDAVRIGDLNRPTPCAGWNLGDLLAHMTVQHRGFAAAARGLGDDPDVWRPETVRAAVVADPAGSYAAAASDVIEAFAAASPDTPFALPEIAPGTTVPGAMAMGFHFIDYVVHGWDVSQTLGLPFELPADVVAEALKIALEVPDGDFRAAAGAPFGPAVDATGTSDLDRIMRHLGRRPDWGQTYSTVTGA